MIIGESHFGFIILARLQPWEKYTAFGAARDPQILFCESLTSPILQSTLHYEL
jgi:hypothetical protein